MMPSSMLSVSFIASRAHGKATADPSAPVGMTVGLHDGQGASASTLLGSYRVVVGGHGHVAEPCAGGGEDRVSNGRSESDDAGFPGSSGWQVLAVEKDDFDLGRVAEAGDAVLGEKRVLDTAVGEEDALKERAADGHHECTLHLVAQAVGIDDGAALPCLNDATYRHLLCCRIGGDF